MEHHPQRPSRHQSRASLIILIVLAFLLLTASGILVASLPDAPIQTQETSLTVPASPDDSGFACSASEAQQIYPFQDGVMKVTASRIAFLNIRGVEQYAADLDYTAPMIVSNAGYFLAADRDGHSLTLLSKDKVLYRATTEGRISGAAIREDGHLAVISGQSDSTGIVSLYAPITGQKLFDCIFAESGHVLSVSFPADDDSFDVVLVNTATSQARPVIKRFGLDGRQKGELKPDLTGLYPLAAYDADGHVVLCGEDSLTALSYTENGQAWTRRFFRVSAVLPADDSLIALASEQQDAPLALHLLKRAGQSDITWPIGDGITNLLVLDGVAALGYGARAIAVRLSDGEKIIDQSFEAEVVRVGLTPNKTLTVVTRTGVLSISANP